MFLIRIGGGVSTETQHADSDSVPVVVWSSENWDDVEDVNGEAHSSNTAYSCICSKVVIVHRNGNCSC